MDSRASWRYRLSKLWARNDDDDDDNDDDDHVKSTSFLSFSLTLCLCLGFSLSLYSLFLTILLKVFNIRTRLKMVFALLSTISSRKIHSFSFWRQQDWNQIFAALLHGMGIHPDLWIFIESSCKTIHSRWTKNKRKRRPRYESQVRKSK